MLTWCNFVCREILTFSDGGQAALDWREANLPADAPILIALPGLTGSSSVEYMKNIALTMNSAGIRCVVFNNRGLGGLQLKVVHILEIETTGLRV